jgi:hypothetical protein
LKITFLGFKLPNLNPKLCINWILSTILATAIDFPVAVHRHREARRPFSSEPIHTDARAIFNSAEFDETANPTGAAVHGCLRFTIS